MFCAEKPTEIHYQDGVPIISALTGEKEVRNNVRPSKAVPDSL